MRPAPSPAPDSITDPITDPIRPVSRRRRAGVVLVVGLFALVAGACHPDNTPKSYDAQNSLVPANFVQGCTGQGTSTTLAPTDGCRCAIEWIVAHVPYDDANKKAPTTIDISYTDDPTTTVPVSQTFTTDYSGQTFKQIDSDLASHPENLPQDIQDGISQACASHGWHATSSAGTGGAPTTSAGG